MGWDENPIELYYGIDLLVMPSLAEGLGVSILEAMAAGLPVVGTHVGGIPDIIKDGKTGYLVAPKNSQAISQGIKSILKNLNKARAMGKTGQTLVHRQFSAQAMSKANESLYLRLMAEKGTATH